MALCSVCGKSMGFFAASTICDACRATMVAELQAKKAQNVQIALEDIQKQKERLLLPKVQEVKSKIENGEKIYLYDTVYAPVDSIVNGDTLHDEFSIGLLRRLGLQGWEVVGIVPRTFGVGLTNRAVGSTFGETWGAGLGGNVMGGHIMIKMDVSKQNLSDAFLSDYIMRYIDDFLTSDEIQMLSEMLQKATEQETL